ncbi:MAG: hypothetical protein MK101_07950 [Phycisphaerales bacterium]|nr:hypothetical protein [Phycisphaerales bacterium]
MDIAALIFPAVVAGFGVWIAAAIMWMFSGIHNKDVNPLPDEAGFLEHLKGQNLPAGQYMWPNCQDRKDVNSDAFKARWKAGPWGTLNIMSGQPNFLRNLIGSFILYTLIAFAIAAAIASVLNGVHGAEVLVTCTWCQVFTPSLILAAAGYMAAPLCMDLFMGKQVRFMITQSIDGLIYAGVTALVLTLMWPV